MVKKSDNKMSLTNLISLGIGSIIGAGIFALLGQAVTLSGQHTYFAFIFAGIAAMFSGYSYTKLAAKYHSSGGLTEYFHQAFPSHRISGTLSIIYVLTSAASISMMAKAFGIYITEFFISIPPTTFWIDTFAVLLIIFLSFLNMLKANQVGRFETLFVLIKISMLLALVVAALLQTNLSLSPIIIDTTGINFMRSIGITFFAYTGFEVITNATPYVSKPNRTIQSAIYITLLIVMLIYVSLTWVVIHFTPLSDIINNTETTVAIAASRLLGKFGYIFIFFAAIMAFTSGINATFFSIYRINISLSTQGILPKIFTKKLFDQGNLGNLIVSLLIILATLSMDFTSIVNLSCAAYLICYLGIFAANLKLKNETKSSTPIILIGTAITLFIFIAFIISII